MAGTSAAKVEYLPVSLKTVAPVIPESEEEKVQLIQDLEKMGCEGLILEPWFLRSESIVQEFQAPRSNEWAKTIRRDPEHWTANLWAEVYNFRKEGRMRAGRTETWIDGKFRSPINSKDGHSVEDCINPREKRVLEFVIPILYPEKPGRVTKEIGNTVFGALCGEYKVSWGMVIHEVVEKLVSVLGKRKPTPVSPYLFHLYGKFNCLRKEESQQLEVAKECLEFGVPPEQQPDDVEESDRGSLSPEVRPTVPAAQRAKATFKSPRGKESARSPERKDLAFLDMDNGPFQRVSEELGRIQNNYSKMEVVLRGASRLLGDCKLGNIGKEIRKLKQEDGSDLKAHNKALKLKITDLQVTVQAQDAEVRRLRTKAEGVERISAFLGSSSDVVTKAHLFDNDVKKEDKLSQQKIVQILVKFAGRIEAAMEEMRKLLPGTTAAGSSQDASSNSTPITQETSDGGTS